MTDYNNNLLKCIDGYKMVNDECVEDIICPLNCEKCQNTELCQKCNSGYLLENGICREQCSNGFEKFSSGEECLNCNNNLCIIFEINSCNCINCKENYFLKEDKTCQECDQNCLNCEEESTKCISCKENYFLYSNKCFSRENPNCKIKEEDNCKCKECNEKFNLENYLCNSCINNCIICKDSLTCEKCEEGYNNTNPYICEINKLKEEKKLISHCKINDILSNNCELDYKDNNTYIEDEIISRIKEDLTKGFNTSLLDYGNDIIIQRNTSKYIISSNKIQENERNKTNNKSNINLGNCEINLRKHYNITKEEILYILMTEIKIDGMKVPKIDYEIYYPFYCTNLTQLDLSICENDRIIVSNPIIIDDIIDKYNPKSGTDISIKDRREEYINNNMSLCEEDCTFEEYDFNNNKSICSCGFKINIPLISNITIDKNKLYKSFTSFKNIANVNILKCYKLLLQKEKIIKNIGCYIFIPVIILYFVSIIIFGSCEYKKPKSKIDVIIYAKNNWKRLKEIFDKSNNQRLNSHYNKNNIINKNKTKNNFDNNNNLITQNKIKTKKVLDKKENKRKHMKNNNIKTNIMNNQSSKMENLLILNKNKNNNKNRNLQKIKTNPISNMLNPSRKENKIPKNISGLNIIQKFQFCEKTLEYNDYQKNNLSYQDALKSDKRSFLTYYLSLLKTNHLFIFSFFQSRDYNSKILKIFLFFFIMIINLTVKALFFDDATMHLIYNQKGKFDIIYQIPKILYSAMISWVLTKILSFLSLTEKTILPLKDEKYLLISSKKEKDVLSNINRKVIIFFVLSFFLLIFFWYYVACFCAVYKNTQIHLVKDFVVSFITSLIYPLFICLLPGIFRISALKSKKKETMYKFSKFIQSFC